MNILRYCCPFSKCQRFDLLSGLYVCSLVFPLSLQTECNSCLSISSKKHFFFFPAPLHHEDSQFTRHHSNPLSKKKSTTSISTIVCCVETTCLEDLGFQRTGCSCSTDCQVRQVIADVTHHPRNIPPFRIISMVFPTVGEEKKRRRKLRPNLISALGVFIFCGCSPTSIGAWNTCAAMTALIGDKHIVSE